MILNNFTKKFNLSIPLVLSPLAGGPGTPELVAAVSEAGGLGTLGAAYLNPEQLEKALLKTFELTKKPFGVNLFVPTPDPVLSASQKSAAIEATAIYRQQLNLATPNINTPFSENFDQQLQVILKYKPAVFTFIFGLISAESCKKLKTAGIYVIGTATSLAEAKALSGLNVDAIILQGVEAGGHRGLFDSTNLDHQTALDDLITACVNEKITQPLIAAGGIMDGAGIALVLSLGASAAQMGTAFLLCAEAGTSAPYKEKLLTATGTNTKLTRAFSGRFARGIENKFLTEMQVKENSIMPFPAQNVFTRDLRAASAQNGSADFLSLWAGTGVAKIRSLKAADLVQVLRSELDQTLKPT